MEQTTIPSAEPKLYNAFLETGKSGKNQWWRYLLGVLIVSGFYIIGQIPFGIAALRSAKHNGHSVGEIIANQDKLLDPSFTGMDPNVQLVFELFIFVAAMVGLWIAVRFLHGKKFVSIITSAQKIRWKRFWMAFVIWFLFGFIGQLISMAMYPDNCQVVFNLKPFLITLIIGITLLPIQTWFEEFFMRGYLMQGLGLFMKKAIFPILITGTLFGLAHMGNPEVKAYGVATMLPAYLLPGIFFAIFAALDEGLESAMGIHFANNLFGTIGVTSASSAIQANTIWSAKGMFPMSDNTILLAQLLILFIVLKVMNKWQLDKLYK